MALFNEKYLVSLLEKVQQGQEMIENLEKINKLRIPLHIAKKNDMENRLSKWIPYGAMGNVCMEIVQKLQKARLEEEKKEAKKEDRKRKSAEKKELAAKKVKLSPEEVKENSGESTEVPSKSTKKTAEPKKKVAPKKTFAPLFKKSMMDRRKIRC